MVRFLALALLLVPGTALAQREGLLQIGSPLSDLVRRQATAGHLPQAAADALPLPAGQATAWLDSLAAGVEAGRIALSRADRQLLARYQSRTPASTVGRPLPLGLYGDGVSPFRTEGDGYAFEASPLLALSSGPVRRSDIGGRDASGLVYQNTRGVRVAGRLGRLYVESRATENQRRPAVYARDSLRATAPRFGFVKRLGDDAYDYFAAEGAVGYRDRFVDVRLARDRNAWGAGAGTLFLSNYAAPYDHLRIGARAGPVSYTMAVARLTTPDRDVRGRDTVLPSAYAAFHRVSVEVGRVQAEAFEAVVFHDDTLRGNRRGLELGYLNPVIFYRSVESELGSGDNALLGAGLAVRPVDGVRVYGQVLLDEFRASTFFEDAWTNKWGLLAGVHTVDLGVPGLEARAEYARLRPYLWGHRTVSSAYVHYNDILGHPVGPNADDASLRLEYRPSVRTTARLTAARTRRGRDPDGVYVGQDPRVPYTDRDSDVAPTFVGVRQTEWLVEGAVAFEVAPRLAVEAAGLYRSLDDAERGLDRALAATLGLRWEIPFQSVRD
ncbi:hypothetical protein [Rubrivirga sp.]|uniref:hypothetical protein n=1 Tax=Rubrivirga sp. TaxID=1885344 RepID=UPI003B523B9B